MRGTHGLSGTVTALILILLSIAAAGIVWKVVSAVLQDRGSDLETAVACLGLDLSVTDASWSPSFDIAPGVLSIIVKRKPGGSEIASLWFLIDGEALPYVAENPGLDPLETTVITIEDTFENVGAVTITPGKSVTVVPTVTADAGSPAVCTNAAVEATIT